MLEKRLNEWMQKVIAVHNDKSNAFADTYRMMIDVDKIISEEFDHKPMFVENV
jgi:hypothetical protein